MIDMELSHLVKARALLEAGDEDSLRYCCLELRMALELICYERLEMHRDELPTEALRTWKPQQVIALISECDPAGCGDQVLRLGVEHPDGSLGPAFFQATLKGVSKRLLRDHYHWLGSYLHAPTPDKFREDPSMVVQRLRSDLPAVVAMVEEYSRHPVLANLGVFSHFTCSFCGTKSVHNSRALKEGGRVACTGPGCGGTYTVHEVDGPSPQYRPVEITWDCPKCQQHQFLGGHLLKVGYKVVCTRCDQRATVAYCLVSESQAAP